MSTKRLITLLGLAGFIVMADNWVVSPILPAIAHSLDMQPARAGVLIAAYMLPFGAFQLLFGPLADRYGKLRVVLVTLILFSASSALCGFGLDIADLALYRALTGLFAAATMPVSLALISDLVPPGGRQRAIGAFMGIAFLGQASSMIIGGSIAFLASWRAVFFTYGAMGLLFSVLLLLGSRHLSAAQLSRDPQSRFLAPYLLLLRHPTGRRAYLLVLAYGVFILGSFSYLGADLAHSFGLSDLAIGAVMTAFGVGVVLAGRIGARLAETLGVPRLIALGLLLAAAADAAAAVPAAGLWLTTLGVFLLGLGFMLAHSTLLTMAASFAPKARGTTMSLVAFAFFAGGFVGTMAGSHLIAAAGYRALFLGFAAALAVLGLAAALLLQPCEAASPARQAVRQEMSDETLPVPVTTGEAAGRPVPRAGRPTPLALFLTFLRLGLTGFGGPAMLVYIGEVVTHKKHWVSEVTYRRGLALSQSVPGATAMQGAAYLGLAAAGGLGAAAAYVGFVLPAVLLMLAFSVVYQSVIHLTPVVAAFAGLQVIVVALVANGALSFGRTTIRGPKDALLAAAAGAYLFVGGSPLFVIAAAAGVGMLIYRKSELASKPGAPTARGPAGPESEAIRGWGRPALIAALAAAAGLGLLYLADPRLFSLGRLMMLVDLSAFGGGFASVPYMLREVVGVHHWMSSSTFMTGIALGQVTPGPIVITATFVGYRLAGLLGALVATVAVFTPSFIVITALAPHVDRLQHSTLFQKALRGILGAFVGLLVAVCVRFGLAAPWSLPAILIALAAFVALLRKVNILWVVLVGALLSAVLLQPGIARPF